MACGKKCNSTTHTPKECELENAGHEGDHEHTSPDHIWPK
jgi:hypothetical protein